MDYSLPGSFCQCDFSGKNTGVGCHVLLQGISPTQGLNRCLLCLLHWKVHSLSLVQPGSPLLHFPNMIQVFRSVSKVPGSGSEREDARAWSPYVGEPTFSKHLRPLCFPLIFSFGPTTMRIIICSWGWDTRSALFCFCNYFEPEDLRSYLLKLKSCHKQKYLKHFFPN